MRRDDYIDFHAVKPEHERVHGALLNWARWCGQRRYGRGSSLERGYSQTHPMWIWAKPAQQWDAVSVRDPVDVGLALAVQREMRHLPVKHSLALSWCYIQCGNPARAARNLAVNLAGLMDLVSDGRTMLRNRMGDT